MRKLFLTGSAVMSLFAVGCVSPEMLCMSSVNQTCERLFECRSEEMRSSDSFKSYYGTTESECKAKLEATAKCSEKKEESDLCPEGKKFNMDKAVECSSAIEAQTCAEYNDASKIPEACNQICT